jgi:hypothetical protein
MRCLEVRIALMAARSTPAWSQLAPIHNRYGFTRSRNLIAFEAWLPRVRKLAVAQERLLVFVDV